MHFAHRKYDAKGIKGILVSSRQFEHSPILTTKNLILPLSSGITGVARPSSMIIGFEEPASLELK